MAGEERPDLQIVEGGGEGGLAPWEVERVEQARAVGEAFANEVKAEWHKLQTEEDAEANTRHRDLIDQEGPE